MNACLRKAQHNLFAAGAASALAPQSERATAFGPFLHPCSAPGCAAWGAYGIGVFRGGKQAP